MNIQTWRTKPPRFQSRCKNQGTNPRLQPLKTPKKKTPTTLTTFQKNPVNCKFPSFPKKISKTPTTPSFQKKKGKTSAPPRLLSRIPPTSWPLPSSPSLPPATPRGCDSAPPAGRRGFPPRCSAGRRNVGWGVVARWSPGTAGPLHHFGPLPRRC